MKTFESTPNRDALRILDATFLAEAAADDAESCQGHSGHHRGNACGFQRDHGVEAAGTIARAAAGSISAANQAKAAHETATAAYREALRLHGSLPGAEARSEMDEYLARGRRATDRSKYARDCAHANACDARDALKTTNDAWAKRADTDRELARADAAAKAAG